MCQMLNKNLLKIAFSISLVFCLYFHIALHAKRVAYNSVTKPETFKQWAQPVALNATYAEPVSNKSTSYNFSAIEKLLWNFPVSDQGNLELSQQSAKQLEISCSFIDKKSSAEELLKLKDLIQKSIPGQKGSALSDLQVSFCQYLIEKELLLAITNELIGEKQIASLKQFMPDLVKRQEKLFTPEIATQLLSAQNLNLEYFTNSRIINLQADLTAEEKKELLRTLQNNYKNKLDSL